MDPFPRCEGEPLGFWIEPGAGRRVTDAVIERRFELTSRGDRVPGRLLRRGAGDRPLPLILLAHGASGSKEAPYIEATARPWARGGAAVACIDLPLHGERASGKLTERFLAGLRFQEPSAPPGGLRGLWREVTRQAVSDLRRTLDALAELPGIDAERVAFAGFSWGAILGACFCGVDPRPRAAALALAGGGFGPPDLDPVSWIARFAPRPALFVAAREDERIPRTATEALFEAAGDPKELLWFEGGHQDLPGRALKAMWGFLRAPLGIPD